MNVIYVKYKLHTWQVNKREQSISVNVLGKRVYTFWQQNKEFPGRKIV